MTWRRLAAVAATSVCLLAAQPALAYTPPPEPLLIRFDADRLTPAGEVAVDRLAVRGAQCPDGQLRVLLDHAAGTAPARVDARYRAIRHRLAALGFTATYVNRTPARPAAPGAVTASVWSGGSEYCYGTDSVLLRRWVNQVALQVAQPAGHAPAFWARMTPGVRRDDLALTLARTAYCEQYDGPRLPDCAAHPAVFDWLADRAAVLRPQAVRDEWWLVLWSSADDDALAVWQRKLRVDEVPAQSRVWHLQALASSDLPWPTVQRRLLEPGVMAALVRQLVVVRHASAGAVIDVAVRHGQLDALPGLVEAAGPDPWPLFAEMMFKSTEVPDEADAARLLQLLPAGFPQSAGLAERVTEAVLVGALCPPLWEGREDRFATLWDWLLARGFQPDAQALQLLTSKGLPTLAGRCRLEAVPGEPNRFRRAVPR